MIDQSDDELHGRCVLITGASQGIGRAVAVSCAVAGATVVACGRDVTALEDLADEIGLAGHTPPVLLPINLERAGIDDYLEVAHLIAQQFGALDGLVLNAAVLGELAPLAHYDAVTWARVFQVNVHSAFLLLQACQPVLACSQRPSIVFSLAEEGVRAKANWGAYAVSKYALRGLMELSASEFGNGDHVRVNGVIPPAVDTSLRRTAYPAANPREWPAPSAVIDAYLILLGVRGEHFHGQILDGASGKLVPRPA